MRARIREIEEEFGEPIFDVIKGFAEMGYSRSETGRVLGYHAVYFTGVLLRRIDVDKTIDWPGHCRDRTNIELYRSAEYRQRMQQINKANGDKRARRYWVGDRWLKVSEIAAEAGINPDGVYYRLRRGVEGADLIRPPMSRKSRGYLGARVRLSA